MDLIKLTTITVSSLVWSFSSLYAQISNEGIIGASFYGVAMDSTKSVTNQVGPNADFSVPVKLSASSSSTSLFSGEITKLQAVLSLDDGTITLLPSSLVSWSSAREDIIVKNDLVTAQNISKNVRAAIDANAYGFSAILYIRLKRDRVMDSELIGSVKNALSDSIDLQHAGWKKSSWLGNYFDGGNNWIHHEHHGWLYASSNQPSFVWLWSPTQKWLWTGPEIYPHIFRNQDGVWMYFILEALPDKVFYNQSTKKLENQ
jgi:hypothetical protein